MRRLNGIFYLILLMVGFSACNTQSVLVKVYTPAAVELPPTYRRLLVFNRFVPAQGDYERVKWGAYESVDSLVWRAADSCARSLSKVLEQTERFNTRMPEGERMFVHNGDTLPEPLPWAGLLKIMQRNYGDGLAMLEAFRIQEADPVFKQEGSDIQVTIQTDILTGWRFYQPDLRRMLIADVFTFQKDFSASGQSKEDALKNLPDRNERYIEAGIYAGKMMAESINPGIIEVKRKFYSKGNEPIEEGFAFIEKGEWGKAYSKWKYHAYNGETDEIKAMCSYNMAILSEREAAINLALGFARRAQRLMASNLHIDLINELTIRLFEIEEAYESGKIIKNW